MKTPALFLACVALCALTSSAIADPKADVAAGIKKLEGQSNYSWTATPKTEGSEAASRQGPISGMRDKGGLVYVKGSRGDNPFEIAMQGEKIVINYTGDWLTPAELGAEEPVRRLRKSIKEPGEEAAAMVENAAEIKMESEGIYLGELKPEKAKEIFGLLGRRAAEAPEAKGTLKFWLKDGQLAKYELRVSGKITVGSEKREVDVSRTTTVEITEVGTSKIPLPEDAKRKLAL